MALFTIRLAHTQWMLQWQNHGLLLRVAHRQIQPCTQPERSRCGTAAQLLVLSPGTQGGRKQQPAPLPLVHSPTAGQALSTTPGTTERKKYQNKLRLNPATEPAWWLCLTAALALLASGLTHAAHVPAHQSVGSAQLPARRPQSRGQRAASTRGTRAQNLARLLPGTAAPACKPYLACKTWYN